MLRASSLLLVVSCLFVACASAQNPFVGQWVSPWGGYIYLCEDNASNTTQGVYSELGFLYGIVTLEGGNYEYSGHFYEAGAHGVTEGGITYPSNGVFKFILPVNSTTFTGNSSYEHVPLSEGQHWNSTRQSTTVPTESQCWVGSGSSTWNLDGAWFQTTPTCGNDCRWDICLSGTNSTASSSYDFVSASVKGFAPGKCFLNGTICTMDYHESGNSRGIYIVRLVSNHAFWASYWSGTIDDWEWYNIADDDDHGIVGWTRMESNAENCGRHSGLASSASSIVVSMCVAVAAILASLL